MLKNLRKMYKISQKSKLIIEKDKKYNCNNYNPIKVVIERAEGPYVYDVDKKKYLDCISGYSALNQGHLHPKIKKVIIKQLDILSLTSRAMYNTVLGDANEFLCKTFNYEKAIMINSGVEAGETAIKFARKWAYTKKKVPENKAWVLFALKNFWGRTIAACGSSEDPDRHYQFGPYDLNFKLIEYNNLEALEYQLKNNKNIAAYMLEPIQGEGGVIIPSDFYLKGVRDLCDKYNVLMIVDEIQTGLGRTGKMLCQDHSGVKADMVCLGKALSGGYLPISAVLGTDEVFECITPGTHGSTYGGNPLACVTMMESVRVLSEEGMIENSEKRGGLLLQGLREICKGNAFVRDVRGKGLFIGIELDQSKGVKAKDLVYELLEENLLTKDTQDYVLRIAPALTIGDQEMDMILNGFRKVLEKYR